MSRRGRLSPEIEGAGKCTDSLAFVAPCSPLVPSSLKISSEALGNRLVFSVKREHGVVGFIYLGLYSEDFGSILAVGGLVKKDLEPALPPTRQALMQARAFEGLLQICVLGIPCGAKDAGPVWA